jgi:predicted AlkP superfamily phosphohydrolase/phosphomutase
MNKESGKEKIFVFGIDGATFSLINPWIEQGELPTLKSVMERGTAAVNYSTIPPISCPAWKSFATGMNPGKLGVFDLIGREPGTYNIQPSRADMVEVPDVWEILSANRYKVGVFNVPGTYPPRKLHGFVVSGMLGNPDAPDFTYPRELRSEIMNMIDIPYEVEVEQGARSPDEWVAAQYVNTSMKVDVAKYLLGSKEWDFFIAVFYEVDRMQHAFWHYMDKDHPRYAPSHLEDTIKKSYKRMDSILKEFLDLLEDDTTVIIVSDHGFGPIKGFFRLNQWLLSQKYLKLDEASMKAFFDSVAQKFLKKNTQEQPLLQDQSSPSSTIGGAYQIDWPNTKAYSIRIGNVYLNVRGREPQGIIEMGKEYEEVRNQLIEDLSNLVHPITKNPFKITIQKKEEVYSGKYFFEAPDLLVSFEDSFFGQGFGPMWVLEKEEGYATGGHRVDGIFLISGQNIKENQWIDPISIYDVAPTILHLAGIAIPYEMDGRVLSPVFEKGSNPASRDVVVAPPTPEPARESKDFEKYPGDDEKVLKRLRDIGYLE